MSESKRYFYQDSPGYGYSLDMNFTDRPNGPDDDAPAYGPPQQFAQQVPQSFFTNSLQTNQIRGWMCQCLGKWGLLGLRFQGPFGRDIWFYPTEVRVNSVSGYTWQGGRRQRVRYNYNQIRNYMCFG